MVLNQEIYETKEQDSLDVFTIFYVCCKNTAVYQEKKYCIPDWLKKFL